MFTLPSPSLISLIILELIISVCCIVAKQESTCFKIFTSLNAVFISENSSFFSQWSLESLSAQRGNVMFTVSIGNSYKIFPNILLMSSILRLAQSVGITGV